ncbi:MAG: hypothetical protein ACREM1_18070 [Longimicrobiales bacterium]
MLKHAELMELHRASRDENVLSVYLSANQHDPAERNAWRRVLEHCVEQARARLDSNDDRAAFDAALARIRAELEDFAAFLPGHGWVGFATPDRVIYAEAVPASMPDLVRYGPGIRTAPYVRALKQERPVVTVLVDSRRARIFRYADGRLEEPIDLRADMFIGDLTDVTSAKRATTHTGIRGETGTDVAQRLHDVGADRLLKHLAEVVSEHAGHHGFVVVGGPPEVVAAATSRLPRSLAGRVLDRGSLYVDMTPAEVKEATRKAASELTQGSQSEQLDRVLDAARAKGRGSIGREATEKALRDRRVETLLLSRTFILGNADVADRCVGTALEQDADVEELSGEAADRLDRECEGIAAELRYRL